ncbi:RICIN domain-containing protein [Photobacterium halotolerans]|uniref:RICIN domain-containing protein n=1 Tax=Photobacterium halotolerans TaxID=265726 RepID=UPI000483F446|nr:RICIN domain-containing protein [Photobacterium halotolerans]
MTQRMLSLGVMAGALAAALSADIATAQATPLTSPSIGVIQLIDPLDRPKDGFCLDVIGYSPYERLDLPLIAHNCKNGLYRDQAMSLLKSGEIFLPAYKKCLTAIAPHTQALPGAALMARDCGEHSDFLQAQPLQKFQWSDDGEVRLTGSELCLAVGEQSDQTSSPLHRWRALSLQSCQLKDTRLARWQFIDKS